MDKMRASLNYVSYFTLLHLIPTTIVSQMRKLRFRDVENLPKVTQLVIFRDATPNSCLLIPLPPVFSATLGCLPTSQMEKV